ncbi:MAG: DNA repair protein RecO, partial [Ignavibacteriae bacterium]|nr:DNA repair protein RecO [Ignavibacteriota bacterium]
MSHIVKTEAVVLRSMKYRESSKIVTFYTRQFGKISVIAKGARLPKSNYGSALEPMSYVSTVLYKKDGREIQTLSQADVVKSFLSLRENLQKMAVGMTIIELVNVVVHEQEENAALFNLLVDSLSAVNDATKNPSNVLYKFEVHLSRILGFQLTFDSCVSCRKRILDGEPESDAVQFHFAKGGLICNKCVHVPGNKVSLSKESFKALHHISSTKNLSDVSDLEIDPESKREIERLLEKYLRYHVSGFRSLKSERVFSK